MTTRLQIAHARAQVALADVSGRVLPDPVRAIAAVDFADADDAVVVEDRESAAPTRGAIFGRLAGVHAAGHDFGPRHNPPRPRAGRQHTGNERESRIASSGYSREAYESAQEAVACGALGAIERRTWQEGLSATLATHETASWLGVGHGRVLTLLALGDLFAFVCDDELRFPAWQFTADPDNPVLDHLARLAEGFGDNMHPSTIVGFMTTPHSSTRIDGQPVTPVSWLTAHRNVQPLLALLETYRWR